MAVEIEKMLERAGTSWAKATLYALAQNLTRQTLQTWGPTSAPTLAEIVDQVEERALRQANVLGGSHAFLFELYDGADHTVASEVFRVTAEMLPNGVSIAHEPANEGGLLAQLMRHNEAQTRTGVLAFEKSSNAMLRTLEATTRHSETIEAKFTQMLTRLQELVLGEQETKLEIVRVEAQAKTKHMMAERVAGLLPEVIGAVTGKLTGTTGAAAAIKAKGAFQSLRPDQVETIMAALDMDQKIALLGLLKTLAEDDEKTNAGAANGRH